MRNDIMEYIVEHQKGKSGIYPYRLTVEVACAFCVPYDVARDHVLAHIKQELEMLREQFSR